LPANVKIAKVADTQPRPLCVNIMSLRRLIASASSPANKSKIICGTARAKPSNPICKAESVNSYICHAIATVVNWLPIPRQHGADSEQAKIAMAKR